MKKLTYAMQSGVFHGTVRQNGRLFRMCFVVFEREGKLRGKIISCEPITVMSDCGTVKERCLLPVSFSAKKIPIVEAYFQGIVSPFSKLEFFISQMPRAPSFVYMSAE